MSSGLDDKEVRSGSALTLSSMDDAGQLAREGAGTVRSLEFLHVGGVRFIPERPRSRQRTGKVPERLTVKEWVRSAAGMTIEPVSNLDFVSAAKEVVWSIR